MDKEQEKNILKDFDDAMALPRKDQKMRITTMVDADILDTLRERAGKQGIGYQTYLNELLRYALFGSEHKNNDLSKLQETISQILDRLEQVEKSQSKSA